MRYLENEYFLLTLTFGVFYLTRQLQKKTGWVLLNPILLTIAFLIGFLKLTGISYETYDRGGHLINFWLKAAVVALGVPLYLHLETIRKQILPILVSELAGCVVGIVSVAGLAKLMGAYGFDLGRWGNLAQVLLVIFVPVALIVGQNETGSALVFFALFVMLYREGLPGAIPFTGVAMVVYFVVSIKYDQSMMAGGLTPKGSFAVLCLILVFTLSMMRMYLRRDKRLRPVAVICLVAVSASVAVSRWVVPFDVTRAVVVLVVGLALYNFYRWLVTGVARSAWIGLFALMSAGFLYSSGYVFREVLQDHQRVRIEVLLGMVEDPTGVGYNVNQSKIAIGSGGMTGKGFLNGTQTKLKYVPEQDTDFIFCTVGEEQGFVGAAGVLLVYLAFILRLIHLAERQDRDFARIYGYCVASIFLFHVFVNVGMVLGLVPVIGIPLPFFSYGGSSLWGFTILLFVFLRLDAGRGSMA